MRMSPQINEIATALVEAQKEMKNAIKGALNPHFKNKYADLAEMRDATVPHLNKHGIAMTQGTMYHEGMWCVVTVLAHKSGQWISSEYPFALDRPQAMGAAYTYARRYSLSAIVGIASEEDNDGNGLDKVPELVMPAVNGTVGSSAAGERPVFDKLVKDIRNFSSRRALEAWYQSNITVIDTMPPSFVDELRVEYADKLSELKKELKV